MLFVELCESVGDHLGFRHREDRAAAADQEGIPAGDNAAQTADDQHLCHDSAVEHLLHRERGDKSRALHRRGDLFTVERVADREHDQTVEYDSTDDGEEQNLRYFL